MGCFKLSSRKFFFFLSLVLLSSLFSPHPLLAANYDVNVGTGTVFVTQSSLNPADIGTNKITVGQGDTITWTWIQGGHSVTSSTGTVKGACSSGDTFDTGLMNVDDTFSQTFNNLTPAGNPCKWYCTAHAGPANTTGMIGYITVVVPPPPTLSVTLSGSGSGSVSSSPAGIDCGATCSSQFTSGTSVTLTATAASGSNFAGFSGGCVSSSTSCTVSVTSNLSVTAKFNSASGGGSGDFETTGLFDSDSVPDLVVASNATHKISLYPMTSGGGFVGGNPPTPSFRMTDTDTYMGLSSGSFNSNSDSNDDIVLLESDVNGTTYLNIYYGNRSTGTFPVDGSGKGIPSKQIVVNKTVGTGSETLTSVEARDVNGDGKADLVVTIAPATAGGDPTPKILLGNGDGTFSGTTQYFPGPVLTTVVVAPASAAIVVTQPQQFTPTGLDQYSAVMTGITYTWSSSNPAICSVDTHGLALGVAIGGPVTITATGTDGVVTVSGTALCTVSAPTDDVSAVSISSTMSLASLFINNSIQNLGPSTLSTVDIGFYLSTDTTLGNADDKYIGKRTVTGLASGATSAATTTLTLSNIPTGTYYVGMVADYNHKVYETNENNNSLIGTATYLIGPDLQVNSLSGTLSGATLFVSDTEINHGNQGSGDFTVSFYLSAGTTPNPSTDALIGSRAVTGLAVNGTSSSVSSLTIPISLAVGSYHLCAITDSGNAVAEINETNNNFCTTTLFVVGPDLRTSGISGSLSGVSIFVSDTQQNSGDQPAGAFSVSSYFSLTSPFNSASPGYLIGTRNITSLAVGTTNSATVSYAVPSGAPVGTYYLCSLSDSANTVLESNESNNATCTANTYVIGPDLRVSSLSATKSVGNMIVSDTEINSGNQAAGSFTVSYYLSTDTVYGSGDTFLGTRNIAGLAGASATNTATTTFAIPGGLSAGTYYVIAVSDSGNAVVESNEANNTLVTAGTYSLP